MNTAEHNYADAPINTSFPERQRQEKAAAVIADLRDELADAYRTIAALRKFNSTPTTAPHERHQHEDTVAVRK